MASDDIGFDTGALMSAVLEGILDGFSLLMFMGSIWSLTYKQHVRYINRPIIIVAILLLLLSTVHIVVNIIRVEDGLVKYRNTYPGGPVAFFADISQETYVIKDVIYVLQTLLADGVVIYRCYVVWQSVRVIILPGMLWCSAAVTGVHALYNVSQSGSGTSIFSQELATWVMAFFVSTIAANVLSSGLLAYRIWTIERDVATIRSSTQGTMMPIVHVLMDAAILYSMALIAASICFLCSNNGVYVMVDMVTPIISIAFYMVLIRIAINRHILLELLDLLFTRINSMPRVSCLLRLADDTYTESYISTIGVSHLFPFAVDSCNLGIGRNAVAKVKSFCQFSWWSTCEFSQRSVASAALFFLQSRSVQFR
ncbi:uncharacterized protein EDB93DRAFT_1264221 [Suillus bovinus]|uniref:uncharacterized protein n=1 Tax=Suillus bovinus TaxID=48563 RepID=UPI001B861BD1|nr:uncharacterized protein EDB93DRAFT_1264221 [Suillus bovinus]KAG2130168.1 hypothetical protein EDB93DRAFT_1264221 [Suillus bovinus]